MNETKKRFWQNKTFWIVILLIIFAPVGLFLMWYYKKEWNKNVKIAVTVVSTLFFVYALSSPTPQPTSVNPNTSMTQRPNDVVKNKVEDEKKELEEKKKVEEQTKIEAEKKKTEEQAKIEAEKKKVEEQAKAEEQAKIEAEKKRVEEQARVEAEKKRAEAQATATQNVQTAPKERYATCKEMKKVHPKGAKRGDAWYDERLDGDNDGHACE